MDLKVMGPSSQEKDGYWSRREGRLAAQGPDEGIYGCLAEEMGAGEGENLPLNCHHAARKSLFRGLTVYFSGRTGLLVAWVLVGNNI